jgi:soluble lytic murein transglycosylase
MTGFPSRPRLPGRLFQPLLPALLAAACLITVPPARAQGADATVVDAREAARKRDRNRLAAARATLEAANHPLLSWVAYWDLAGRLPEATVDEVEAFYGRWAGTYVEDRLRNDWLKELGKRRDWANLARDYPRFRMNDDREVTCWWLFTEHLAGRDVAEQARPLWWAQRDLDDGCNLLATALVDAKKFAPEDVYRKARLAIEQQRPGAAKAAIGLLGNAAAKDVADAVDNPAKHLARLTGIGHQAQELRLLSVMRLAQTDAAAAAARLDDRTARLNDSHAAWGWAYVARQSAFQLSTDAAGQVLRALSLLPRGEKGEANPGWSDETLAWGVRALLRGAPPAQRWPAVARLIGWMSPNELRDPAWAYWKARALLGSARPGAEGEAQRAEARAQLEALAGTTNFYAKLATEDLGRPPALPPTPAPLTEAEQTAAAAHPGLQRALLLVNLGLRDEARREWNFSLRGMDDRALMAAARLACDRQDWQLCINTAERTRAEVDLRLRYPMPFADDISAAARAQGLEPALVFGLIRQETRFMPQLKSSVGASGLMQVMPATAKWVAKKIGMAWDNPALISDPATNLKLGTAYLKLVLDDLGGSQAMAAAAYNAGPGRPRRWREGPALETAVWAENIPFNETRDYVKKVLSNASVYAALLDPRQPPALRPRLGPGIGPRDGAAPAPNTELP